MDRQNIINPFESTTRSNRSYGPIVPKKYVPPIDDTIAAAVDAPAPEPVVFPASPTLIPDSPASPIPTWVHNVETALDLSFPPVPDSPVPLPEVDLSDEALSLEKKDSQSENEEDESQSEHDDEDILNLDLDYSSDDEDFIYAPLSQGSRSTPSYREWRRSQPAPTPLTPKPEKKETGNVVMDSALTATARWNLNRRKQLRKQRNEKLKFSPY